MILAANERDPLGSVFVQNRTEELGADVWRQFVIPPFFEKLELRSTRKPSVIIGGRGCGKTMLLRYLSYTSTLSQDRDRVPEDVLGHVGLYWRADTQFARMLTGRGIEPEQWASSFDHLLALVVAIELVNSLYALSKAGVVPLREEEIDALPLPQVGDFLQITDPTVSEVRQLMGQKLRQFELWVPNVRRFDPPVLVPSRPFLESLIAGLCQEVESLRDAVFFVYIDEYENLLEYQQRIVNTHIKHSTPPLIFNVAMKRNAFQTTRTVGDESIVEPDDYRVHDIEAYLAPDFTIFASEVLLSMLSLARWQVPIDVSLLRDPQRMAHRATAGHKERVLGTLKEVFPRLSSEDIANEILADPTLRRALLRRVANGLNARGEQESPEIYLEATDPRAAVVTAALVHRRGLTSRSILTELKKLREGRRNRFTSGPEWIHNNFLGAALSIYESAGRQCPIYAGLDTFALMSRNNMRHFLELCHQSLVGTNGQTTLQEVAVSAHDQAQAARRASVSFVRQIRSFGPQGNRLHGFVLRLGSLFSLAHQRASQSEPEQTHFVVSKGKTLVEPDLQEFLGEAIKWSVLFEEEETKKKDPLSPEGYEYILNPIYAPFFHISYRKKRRMDFSVEDLRTLAMGAYDDVQKLLRHFVDKWNVDLAETNPSLFSHLSEGDA